MKKILLTVAGTFLMLTNIYAQSKPGESKLGVGLDAAVPVGAFKNVADYGIGISLLYQHNVAEFLNITGSVGYVRFHGPAVFNNIKYKEGYVPIKGGARYFIVPVIYAAAEIGVAIPTANGYGTGTAFIYTPRIGTEFKVSETGTVDIGLSYENWSRSAGTRSFVGIRAGYNF